jgi:heterodisulfide reductase subunit B
MKYMYYPGCSLKSSGKGYEESLLAVFRKLGFPLEEINDWNCCGATNYMSIDEIKAVELTTRNLALAEMQSKNGSCSLIAPCSACYMGLLKTRSYLENEPEIRDQVMAKMAATGLSFENKVKVRHPLDVLVHDIGVETIQRAVIHPLTGIKVASYYGCQLTRPISTFDDQHNPQSMDILARAVGAETIDWPLKTRCCSGSLTSTISEIGMLLNRELLKESKGRGGDVITTSCPLCQFNLECFQNKISRKFKQDVRMPVMYFTQLMGLAFGLSEKELGLSRQISPALKLSH